MNKNNLNNKFGKCCNCPALANGNQFFTNFESSRLYNYDLQQKYKLKNSHDYRLNLQNNAAFLMLNENVNFDSQQCTSDKQNKFYIDSSKYNFSTKLSNDYSYPKIPNNYFKKSQTSKF